MINVNIDYIKHLYLRIIAMRYIFDGCADKRSDIYMA